MSSGTLTTWAVFTGSARETINSLAGVRSRSVGGRLENFAAPHAWGMMEQKRGNYDKARKLLIKSLEITPRSTTYNALANLENRVGDRKQK